MIVNYLGLDFINKNLGKSDLVLLGFNFSQNFTFCEVSNLTDFPIPYNDKFFHIRIINLF